MHLADFIQELPTIANFKTTAVVSISKKPKQRLGGLFDLSDNDEDKEDDTLQPLNKSTQKLNRVWQQGSLLMYSYCLQPYWYRVYVDNRIVGNFFNRMVIVNTHSIEEIVHFCMNLCSVSILRIVTIL